MNNSRVANVQKRAWQRWFWRISYTCLVVLVAIRLFVPAAMIEQVYGQGLYPVIQTLLKWIFAWWPFPATLLGIALVVAAIGSAIIRLFWRKLKYGQARAVTPGVNGEGMAQRISWGLSAKLALTNILRTLSLVALFFLLNWGINYARPSVPEHLGLPKVENLPPLSTEALAQEVSTSLITVNRLRELITMRAMEVNSPPDRASLDRVGANVQATMKVLNYPVLPTRPIRMLPAGMLLRWGTSGVFSPWTGDPHVDKGLHPLQIPFVAAHELAHGQGITDEGDCNLVAYLVGRRSRDLLIVYGSELTYFRYLRNALARRDAAQLDSISAGLSSEVRADLAAIRAAMDRFKEIAPATRDLVYDQYLRSQGVHEGMASYSRIIDWVVATRSLPQPLYPGDAEADLQFAE